MMVVLVIIALITTIALFGQQDFNRSLLLTDTAYTIALTAREAQSLGLSSRRYTQGGQDAQNAGYGLSFTASIPNQYVLFADTRSIATPLATCPRGKTGTPEEKPGNCVYDAAGSPPDGLVQTHTFTRGFHISEVCGTRLDSGAQLCASANELSAFYAVWMRPNTETVLTMLRPDGSYVAAAKGVVYLQSQDQTARRAICFSGLGQVSVATSTCP